ncbi:hypothetical protein PVT01_000034000 [Plasmodium vivax]|uniref:VIR protein n=1 Tax=Plasmodium vivax TaxID=5855 RepID=A0A1G4E9C2_PLAVI|nr:hypothetical protein PVT01_000034000 [Plasmodium vivax]
MATSDKDFSVDKIKQEYKFIKDSNFYKIYDEFNKNCDLYVGDIPGSCYKGELGNHVGDTNVTGLLKDLYSNLYRIYYTMQTVSNDYFENKRHEVIKMGYIYLKYWLYDKITKQDFNDSQIQKIFDGWKNYIKDNVPNKPENSCIFFNLNKNEMKKFKKIYAFSTILYENVNSFESHNNNSKYMDYFGEGLDEFISSINKCSIEKSTDNYCNEFTEFLNICKDGNEYAGIIVHDESTKRKADRAEKYLLASEIYKDNHLYIYLNDKKMLNFLKTSNFLSNKYRTTIAATSVVGSAIGLSSIFYYFYKVNLNSI